MTDRQILIPTLPGLGRGLINHDDRSKNFRAVDLLTADQSKPVSRSWRRGGPYDQGQTSKCVPNAGKGILNTTKASSRVAYKTRSAYSIDDWYAGAQRNDEWPGEAYDGTSGLGLLRYLKSINIVNSYHWAFGLNEALLALSYVGPIGLGIMWTHDMFTPDANGFLHATGGDAGGHEIEALAVNVTERSITVCNSWGPNWGKNGRAKMSWDTFETLLAAKGDSFVITG